MQRKPAAFLWDMDGTIVDSDQHWATATMELLERHNATISRETGLQMVGLSLFKAAEILQQHGVKLPATEIVDQKVARVLELYDEIEHCWRPGARELLAAAKAAEIPNQMVTMAFKSVGEKVASLLPVQTFVGVLGGDEVTRSKPDPEPYLLGAERVGVSITDCVVFEDSNTGIAAGAASGAVTIGIRNLVDISSAPAHLIIDSLLELDLEKVIEIYNQYRGKPPIPGGYGKKEN